MTSSTLLSPFKQFIDSLGISDHHFSSVLSALQFTTPSEIQKLAIPMIIKESMKSIPRPILGIAPTGSGKTASFVLPMLNHLAKDPYGIFGLILSPTRELAMQIYDQVVALGSSVYIKASVIVGGQNISLQSQVLSSKPHIIVATPGRLIDFLSMSESTNTLSKGSTGRNTTCDLSRLKYLVLDEADRLLAPKTHFIKEIAHICKYIPTPEQGRNTLLFSATWWSRMNSADTDTTASDSSGSVEDQTILLPLVLKALGITEQPLIADVTTPELMYSTPSQLSQLYLFIPSHVKTCYFQSVLQYFASKGAKSSIVFTSTVYDCELLHQVLYHLNIKSDRLHSLRSQDERISILTQFRSQKFPILIATDLASRGLDIPNVDVIINYNIPKEPRDYVHRIGRTARFNKKGTSLSLVTQYDITKFTKIEKKTGVKMSLLELPFTEDEVLSKLNSISTIIVEVEAELDKRGFIDAHEKKKGLKNRFETVQKDE